MKLSFLILLFANVPRISMDVKAISNLLKLSATQIPMMNNVVGYID